MEKRNLYNPLAPAENENHSGALASHRSQDDPPASHSGLRTDISEFSSLPQRRLKWGDDPTDAATFPENHVAVTRYSSFQRTSPSEAGASFHRLGTKR